MVFNNANTEHFGVFVDGGTANTPMTPDGRVKFIRSMSYPRGLSYSPMLNYRYIRIAYPTLLTVAASPAVLWMIAMTIRILFRRQPSCRPMQQSAATISAPRRNDARNAGRRELKWR